MMRAATDPADVFELHVNLIRHGRRICSARNPACRECPLLGSAPTASARRVATSGRLSVRRAACTRSRRGGVLCGTAPRQGRRSSDLPYGAALVRLCFGAQGQSEGAREASR